MLRIRNYGLQLLSSRIMHVNGGINLHGGLVMHANRAPYH